MADTENTNTTDAKDGAKAPDWTEDTFDADRAKRLVANLRAEIADLKGEVGTLKTERDSLKSNSGTETEKVKAAEDRAKAAEKALWMERVFRKHPELEDDELAEFLDGDTEEAIVAKAERLSRLSGKKKDDSKEESKDDSAKDGAKDAADKGEGQKDAGENADDGGLPGKPTPDLKPGHGGEPNTPFDPAAIAQAARAQRF